jgi:hypothetical protein
MGDRSYQVLQCKKTLKDFSFHLSISGTLIESWMDFTTRGIFGRRKGNDIFLFSYMEGFAMPPIFEAF